MVLARLFRRKPFLREGYELYTAAVTAARDPALYTVLAAPDTLEGRFDLICLHVGLLIRRLRLDADPAGKDLAQAVFDAMFNDMDLNLREMGVGDMGIGKRVKRMWEAFHGRAKAYEEALEAGDEAALADALLRNLWGGHEMDPPDAPARLAARAFALSAVLAGQGMAALKAGQVDFPVMEQA
ncbi:ubiquinol-cytochrome C chaperone [Rhodovarius crocodyli]|uniref:Ubiquinol-cytochrome C chaperone n=1 Tax=Rhodovarius crocodyli TaxID=1979269 RepID=A0A437LZC3_9PROT|nr:ubiquinol-cytochrome C chaperone family protein [Rhodovarius crocodyli]RVT90696.1 ubiquinol-cytochrome C chaperone [Rhodovarius crocodyli]